MNISSAGLDSLVKRFEGLSLKAYPDPATKGIPYTIGYGHTGGVKPTDTCTLEEACNFLATDIKSAERSVSTLVSAPLNQFQFDALVSFVFNIGEPKFRVSTLLSKVNGKDYEGASKEFVKWKMAAGKVMNGLLRRREAEAKWFNTEV